MSGTPALRWITLFATTLLLAAGASAQAPAKGFGLPGIGAKAAKAEPTDSASVVKAELVQAAETAAPNESRNRDDSRLSRGANFRCPISV
jgi:hypothetical protein